MSHTAKPSAIRIDARLWRRFSLSQRAPGKFCRRINLTIRDAIPTGAGWRQPEEVYGTDTSEQGFGSLSRQQEEELRQPG